MQRILIIGSGGAGKSTLARQLGERLQIEVVHLDALYWQPHWVETPKPEWLGIVQSLVQQDAWIMDGNYGSTLDLRLQAADTVIFLDMPTWLCIWRVLKRRWMYAGRTRPDMGPHCPEQLNWDFIQWVWTYRDRRRPALLATLADLQGHKRIVILRSPAEVQQFLRVEIKTSDPD